MFNRKGGEYSVASGRSAMNFDACISINSQNRG